MDKQEPLTSACADTPMIKELWLIGIGAGSEKHVTLEGIEAIRNAGVILVPHKGPGKDSLATIRHKIVSSAGFGGEVINVDYPVRDTELPYLEGVERWHDEIAHRWQAAMEKSRAPGPVALLVWGDPSLYDSTMRIAERLDSPPTVRVVPGITSVQALTSACKVPLTTLAGSVLITTGRNLRQNGWPKGVETVVVMLDGDASFTMLKEPDLYIWWGAYLGTTSQITMQGELVTIGSEIERIRQEARSLQGWIMDTYILRRT